MNAPRHVESAHHDGPTGGRRETPDERSDRNWNDILQELRVSLTGTQLIGGFLLAVAFQPRFVELDDYQLGLYLVLVVLAGLATVVGLAPVTLHRALFRRQAKDRVVRTGDRLLIANLVVVALLLVGVTSLVFDLALGRTAGVVVLVLGAIVLFGLWFVLPRLHVAGLRGDGDRDADSTSASASDSDSDSDSASASEEEPAAGPSEERSTANR